MFKSFPIVSLLCGIRSIRAILSSLSFVVNSTINDGRHSASKDWRQETYLLCIVTHVLLLLLSLLLLLLLISVYLVGPTKVERNHCADYFIFRAARCEPGNNYKSTRLTKISFNNSTNTKV